MGKWPVPDIMDECSADNQLPFVWGEHELPCHHISEIHSSQRVFETGMVSPWIHKKGKSELPDIAKPLECWCIEDGKCIARNLNVPVNRILDDLHLAT
jgi:hypothetical protein